MKLLNSLTTDAKQSFILNNSDGQDINCLLSYLPTQQQWTLNLTFGNLIINGITLVSAPNLLRQFRRQINFGLMVLSNDGLDPMYINDFVASSPNAQPRIKVYLLNSTEVQELEQRLFT